MYIMYSLRLGKRQKDGFLYNCAKYHCNIKMLLYFCLVFYFMNIFYDNFSLEIFLRYFFLSLLIYFSFVVWLHVVLYFMLLFRQSGLVPCFF